jgi:lysozyme
MKATETAKKLLKEREGLRLEAYPDERGIWTIGYGHTPATKGQKISKDEAEYLFNSDLLTTEETINRNVKTKITQPMFDALCVFVFNIGEPQFLTSTILKKINASDFEGAASEFARWNKITVDGKKIVSKGQTTRRAIEESLFRTGLEAVKKAAPTVGIILAMASLYLLYRMFTSGQELRFR